MPTLAQLGEILIACRVLSASQWRRAAEVGGGDLARTLDAIMDEPPEWWTGTGVTAARDAPPGLTDYQRGVIEHWFDDEESPVARQLTVNKFILLDKLGQGGQGEVYRARQLNPSRFVAVKTLARDTEAARRRFEQEARAMMKVQHPGIARFHLYERVRDAAGQPTDEYLIAMEFVPGTDLARLVEETGPLPWQFVVRWAVNLLDGLAVIHENGFIHRDIKPANVMIVGPTPGPGVSPNATSAKLLDFGAVKLAGEVMERSGRKRIFIGTREFAAPEQWMEETVPESDLYALGATLFTALTAQPPYEVEGRDAVALMKAHTRAPVPDVRQWNSEVPNVVALLVRQMLAKSPSDRGSATELARAFESTFMPRARSSASAAMEPRVPAKSKPVPPPRAAEEEATEQRSLFHPILMLLERIFLPRALRPSPGYEPSAGERVLILLRRPVVLVLLAVLIVLLVVWVW